MKQLLFILLLIANLGFSQNLVINSQSLCLSDDYYGNIIMMNNSYLIITDDVVVYGDVTVGDTISINSIKHLTITGDLDGTGIVRSSDNGYGYLEGLTVCGLVFDTVVIEDNVFLDSDCQSLSIPGYEIPYIKPFVVYNILGKPIKEGITSNTMFHGLPKHQLLFVKINDTYKKIIIE